MLEGSDVTIVAEGQSVATAVKSAEILETKGIKAEVIDIRTIKPMDYDTVFKSALKTGNIFCIEENLKRGGMGEMIASEIKLRNMDIKMQIKAIEDEFVVHGSISDLNKKYGFTPEQISDDIERMLNS